MTTKQIRTNLIDEGTQRTLDVEGVQITYKLWSPNGAAARSGKNIVLLHGNAACAAWWDAVAPNLAPLGHVIAIDLSGHGGSEWRNDYEFETWAAEVSAVLEHEDMLQDLYLVGHSMGGLVCLSLGWTNPDHVRGIVMLDTPFRRFTESQLQKRLAIAARPLPAHDTLETAVAKFKTTPNLVQKQEDVWDHIAARSYREDSDGWRLHFDPKLYGRITDVEKFARPFPENTYLVRAEHGLVTDSVLQEMLPCVGGWDYVIDLPGLGHNMLLEAPMTTSNCVQALLARIGSNS